MIFACKYRNRAIADSIDECIKTGVLSDYLKKHRGEVMSFLHVQLNQEEKDAIREHDIKVKIATAMKKANEPLEKIVEYTGLSKEEIEKMRL